MRNKVVLLVSHILVGGVGLYLGYKMASKDLYDEFNAELDKIYDDMHSQLDETQSDLEEAYKDFDEVEDEAEWWRKKYPDDFIAYKAEKAKQEDEETKEQYEQQTKRYNQAVKNLNKSEADLASEEHPTDDDEERMQEAASERESKKAKAPLKPYLISVEQYNLEKPTYAKCALVWALGDDTIYDDETEQPMDNRNEVLGQDNLNKFIANGADQTCYIRNDAYAIDYEVSKVSGSYKELILDDYS